MSTELNNEQIEGTLAKLQGWTFANDKISREYRFASFTEAMGFITEMAFACERANHHPELFNVYSRVNINLTTHDAGNKVTQKDIDLAIELEKIAEKRNWRDIFKLLWALYLLKKSKCYSKLKGAFKKK